MGTMNKRYKYEEVMKICKERLSVHVGNLCEALKDLRTSIENVEEDFHGESGNTIEKNYNQILEFYIGRVAQDDGWTNVMGNGMWKTTAICKDLCNLMYTNADEDKRFDESEFGNSSFR